MSYLPDQMLRNLAPPRLKQSEQRKIDEQLGTAVAGVTRRTNRVIQRVHEWARQSTAPGQAARSFRNVAG